MKIYPNDPCPCGSGKKYKQCCAKKTIPKSSTSIGNFHFDSVEGNPEFIVNRQGAVVFMDESKQPVLNLEEGSTKKTVLSVGFSQSRKPIATIKEDDGVICYILPNWYIDWCTTCIGMSMMGTNLFPAEVIFCKNGEQYSADIL